ncbi:MAG: NusG domain II-containing protein [Leptotrichiaceae bacterium]|nr:NusG domain II-containing protein [Leptotrichiaceae bacterium]MBP6281653.1 NusG domain II-containing protein [Leptotrichiaceae bacterium]MBP7100021.1 NusG domain II-containing protein [Leptotrichiaceae bacterium]MBP7725368.1 NusG domain II-containing protein [Leptotrichiaceae bacterium]MBP9628944.1 NusG domain II-containing protein [Leptotrichiaceae bacterium]
MENIKNIIKKNKKEYGFNKYDIIYIFVAILISFSLLISSKYYFKNSSKRAIVKYNNKEIMALNLKENKIIILKKDKYPLLLGDMHIEVRNGKIGVTKEKSPNHYCSKIGFVSEVTKPIICQPNKVIVLIENKKNEAKDIDLEVY